MLRNTLLPTVVVAALVLPAMMGLQQASAANAVGPLVEAMGQARDPSALVGLFAKGIAADPKSVPLHAAYVDRMVTLGLPSSAYHQARTLVELDPTAGVAWAVIAEAAARHRMLPGALWATARAVRHEPADPFVIDVAGQVLGWHDAMTDRPEIDRDILRDADLARAKLARNERFLRIYNETLLGYDQADTAATASPTDAAEATEPGEYGVVQPIAAEPIAAEPVTMEQVTVEQAVYEVVSQPQEVIIIEPAVTEVVYVERPVTTFAIVSGYCYYGGHRHYHGHSCGGHCRHHGFGHRGIVRFGVHGGHDFGRHCGLAIGHRSGYRAGHHSSRPALHKPKTPHVARPSAYPVRAPSRMPTFSGARRASSLTRRPPAARPGLGDTGAPRPQLRRPHAAPAARPGFRAPATPTRSPQLLAGSRSATSTVTRPPVRASSTPTRTASLFSRSRSATSTVTRPPVRASSTPTRTASLFSRSRSKMPTVTRPTVRTSSTPTRTASLFSRSRRTTSTVTRPPVRVSSTPATARPSMHRSFAPSRAPATLNRSRPSTRSANGRPFIGPSARPGSSASFRAGRTVPVSGGAVRSRRR